VSRSFADRRDAPERSPAPAERRKEKRMGADIVVLVAPGPTEIESLANVVASTGRHIAAALLPEDVDHLEGIGCDVVLVDVDMPVVAGRQLVMDVRARRRNVDMVVVTRDPTSPAASDAMRLGARRTLVKPVQPAALALVLNDIGEGRRVRARMDSTAEARTRSERMAGSGEIAAALAHEMVAPLYAATSRIEAVLRAVGDRQEVVQTLMASLAQLDRVSQLCVNMLDVFSEGTPEPMPPDPQTVLSRVETAITARAAREQVRLEIGIGEDCPPAGLPARDLVEALTHLALNALDAIAATGRGWGTVELVAYQDVNGVLRFEVRDDGAGMSSDVLARSFDAFYTTKGAQRATGLGLTLARRIVESNGGAIAIASELGHGTQVVLTLPASR